MMSCSRQQLNKPREDSTCLRKTKRRVLLYVCSLRAWRQLPWQPYHAATCNQRDNFAWSLAHEQITNHKLFFFFLYALTMAARGLIHWSCMMAIWRASVCLHECARVGVCEEERRQVRSPPASSACITATPVTVSPRASCGLWACAQQSRLTVVPSGMTNYLSCLIHARNSWMRTATLIRKNFHQWKTHLWCEIWHAFRVYPIIVIYWLSAHS